MNGTGMQDRVSLQRLRLAAGEESGGALDNVQQQEEDPADYMDEDAINGGHWLDTEIAVGSIVAILVVAALVALWISCRRRRRLRDPAGEPGTTAERISVHHVQTVHEVKEIPCRKVSCLKSPSPKVAIIALPELQQPSANGHGHPVVTAVSPSSPEPCTNPNGVPEGTPWEPYLLGLPGQVTRARRRSVSLRSGDDEGGSDDGEVSGASSVVSRGPSPTLLSPGDAAADGEATRKRSVTFNALVEEVQILPN